MQPANNRVSQTTENPTDEALCEPGTSGMVPDNGVMQGNPHMTLLHTLMITIAAAALLLATGAVQAQDIDRSSLPIPLSTFEGKSGKTYKESEAAWQHP